MKIRDANYVSCLHGCRVEALQDIPQQPTAYIKPTVHFSNIHVSQSHTEAPQLCPLLTGAQVKSLDTIPKRLTRTCSNQQLTPSHRYKAPTLAGCSLTLNQRKLRPCESTPLGLHQFMPPRMFRFSSYEAVRGLKACHAFMPCCHARRIKTNVLVFINKAQRVYRSHPLRHFTYALLICRTLMGTINISTSAVCTHKPLS